MPGGVDASVVQCDVSVRSQHDGRVEQGSPDPLVEPEADKDPPATRGGAEQCARFSRNRLSQRTVVGRIPCCRQTGERRLGEDDQSSAGLGRRLDPREHAFQRRVHGGQDRMHHEPSAHHILASTKPPMRMHPTAVCTPDPRLPRGPPRRSPDAAPGADRPGAKRRCAEARPRQQVTSWAASRGSSSAPQALPRLRLARPATTSSSERRAGRPIASPRASEAHRVRSQAVEGRRRWMVAGAGMSWSTATLREP